MNILLLIDGLDYGGAETHVITLAEALAAQGNRVSILSSGGALEKHAARSNIRCLHFPKHPRTPLGWLRCLLYLRRLARRERFDVLHAHTRRTALLLRLLPCRLRRDSLPPDLNPQILQTYRPRALLRALAPLRVVTAHAMFSPHARHLSFWGDTTVAVSEDIRRHLRHCFGCRGQIAVIPNGILTRGVPSACGKTEFFVVFASRLDGDCSRAAFALLRIAPHLYRAAAERGRALRLTILGGGECYGALCRAREQLIAAGSVPKESVHLTGAVAEPQDYFAQAQVFVGVSRAALEAAGCGCAVVLAGDEGYGGHLTADNFEAQAGSNFCARGAGEMQDEVLLSDLLTLLQMSDAERRERAERVRVLLRRRYDVSRTAATTLRLYGRALAKKRRLRLLCVGYFGRQNLGDESILRCLLRQFSGAVAPVSLSTTPQREIAQPHTARLWQQRTKSNALYHARRVVYLSCGRHFPAYGMRYRGVYGQERCGRAHLPSLTIPLRLQVRVPVFRPRRVARGYRYGGAAALPRNRLWSVLWSLWKSDALLFGGGSLLQNATRHGHLSLLYYLSLPLLGRLLGCPFSLRANGVGPIFGRRWQIPVGLVLRRAAGISLREERSAVLLLRCGVPRAKISYCPDPVALFAERQSKKGRLPSRRGYICICPREADEATLRHLLALAEGEWAALPRIYVAMDGREDVVPCCRLAKMAAGRVITLRHERAALSLFSGADAVISMRLHALLLTPADVPKIPVPTRATEDKMRIERNEGRGLC